MPPDFINLPHEKELWQKPWTVNPGSAAHRDFKAKLRAHGLLSPHFTIAEAASKAGDPCGCPRVEPTGDDLTRAQYHAFVLEACRHDLGDESLSPLSWLRSECHNPCVGGVSNSQHLNGWATDWSDAERAKHGGDRFDGVFERHFAHGGRGYVGHVGGPIRHVDNGDERTWVYA